ncbi:MmgE/PrpD family protein [Chelativorans salis]|uniref:MmgE/PrpD family protein n=1 Tax=Chelativorans salis TaxID=2978478 RepID=A0ABT2LQ65_9HYPH|nr:MmgE/PrpD family protein [Chelativorans sp. EGI FJ00035]MCT7376688.1 MmgE/PrpD family protein [Chelativorans sp. EGI FJ00035]
MSAQNNAYAEMPGNTQVTEEAARFIETVTFHGIPEEAIRIGKRCMIDAFGLYVAGSVERSVRILADEAREFGGREDARLLGGAQKVPAPMAARVLGTAGHAHDWDDSQVSHDPAHIYGLLTHPTIPPLTAALVMAQKMKPVSGRDFMLAFLTGFEVECKISEWMLPRHYMQGMHSSGTVGHFGAYAAAAKLLGLTGEKLHAGLGIAASFAAGIRCNFGTMTKPLHVGRAAENGVTAALLAARGYTADPEALDGPWGFMAVQGGGASHEKLSQGFGKTWTIMNPGVSIKPYPCGVLTHPTIDLMLRLVREADLAPEDIEAVIVHAGTNILKPIRYPIAKNHLQAKFSLPAALAMIALERKAGKREFSDAFVGSAAMQDMQRRISTEFDPEIEAKGFDKMRSRITIRVKSGGEVAGWADERYRGGPENPLTDEEVEAKLRSCCEGVLDEIGQDKLIARSWAVLDMDDAGAIADLLQA